MGLDLYMPNWDQIDFEPLASYTVEDGCPFSLLLPQQLLENFPCPPLSPPTAAEYPLSPSTLAPPTPDLPTIQQPPGPPAISIPTAPPSPSAALSITQIQRFDFCPFTRNGQVCHYISWACSSNKQIKRHMKSEHFPDSSLRYECPNPKCDHKNVRFLRKDACVDHRRSCDFQQEPGYNPPPHIERGSDEEVNRWMKARYRQKRKIIKKLRDGTPWSTDLLEPVNI